MRTPFLAGAVLAAYLATGCGNKSTTTTTAPTPPTSPTTSTLSSTLTVGGSVSRAFTATQTGTVTVTLTSAGSPPAVVGLGIGVPSLGVASCALSTAIRTAPGASPQIVAPVDPGSYCVVIFDAGALRSDITFNLTIVFP